MTHITNARSNDRPKAIEIFNNKIIIPKNIHSYNETIEEYTISGYEYDCDIYEKDEYLLIQAEHIAELEDQLAATKILLGVDK